VIQQPSFSTYARYNSPAPLILIAMACIAFLSHFSAPDFYHALSSTAAKNETSLTSISDDADHKAMLRYNRMTVAGYLTVLVLNALTLTFGFLTFGGACNGMILNNYNLGDWGAIVSRLLVGMSVVGSYPFVMSSCRAAALEIFSNPSSTCEEPLKSDLARERRMTLILLSVATAISLLVKDVGFVLSLNGALMGSTIAFTFPALLFLKLNEAKQRSPSSIGRLLRTELWLCKSLVGFGIVSAIVGGATTIIDYFFPHLLA
jgi:amino acid permease